MRVTNPLDFLVLFLSTFQDGRAFLSHGMYEYKFSTKSQPKVVWIAETDAEGVPVCHGGVNTFGVRLMEDGFVLVADVKTERTQILWQAFLEASTGFGD